MGDSLLPMLQYPDTLSAPPTFTPGEDTDLVWQFAQLFETEYNVHFQHKSLPMASTDKWETLRVTIDKTALTTFGKRH